MYIFSMYLAESLGLQFLAPQGVIGLFILTTGFVFSLMMFYVGYISVREMYPKKSLLSTEQKLSEQKKKIARL